MASFEILYAQAPHWLWLALACLFVGLSLATGASLFLSPAAAAAVIGGAAAAGVRPTLLTQAAVFVALSLVIAVGWSAFARRAAERRASRIESAPQRRAAADPPRDPTGRLVGRIGKASSDFVNGVGRVWIEDAEWAAELDAGEEVAAGEPVRVVKVIGGVRLQVHPLVFG